MSKIAAESLSKDQLILWGKTRIKRLKLSVKTESIRTNGHQRFREELFRQVVAKSGYFQQLALLDEEEHPLIGADGIPRLERDAAAARRLGVDRSQVGKWKDQKQLPRRDVVVYGLMHTGLPSAIEVVPPAFIALYEWMRNQTEIPDALQSHWAKEGRTAPLPDRIGIPTTEQLWLLIFATRSGSLRHAKVNNLPLDTAISEIESNIRYYTRDNCLPVTPARLQEIEGLPRRIWDIAEWIVQDNWFPVVARPTLDARSVGAD